MPATDCLQECFLRQESVAPTSFSGSAECDRYIGGKDCVEDRSRITEVENCFPFPKETALSADQMHSVKNVMTCLFSFFWRKSSGVSQYESLLTTYLRLRFPCGPGTTPFSISSVPDWVMKKAQWRISLLRGKSNLRWLSPETLEPSGFKALKTHDCMILGFSLFSYLFQDSYRIPAVFAGVKIMECIAYQYNWNGGLRELNSVQCALNVFTSLFQGEVPLSVPTISLHQPQHNADSQRYHGPASVDNSLHQETEYENVKKNLQGGCDPEKAVQKALRAQGVCSVFDSRTPTAASPTEMANPMKEEDARHLLGSLHKDLYRILSRRNPGDDLFFYRWDFLPVRTSLDVVVESLIKNKSGDEAFRCVAEYDVKYPNASSSLQEREDCIPSVVYEECSFKSERLHAYTKRTVVDDPSCLSPFVGFLRLFNNTVAAFLVVGFVELRVHAHLFPQALCVLIQTQSQSSFLETQHNCLIKSGCLDTLLENPVILPISLNRLVMKKALVVPYDVLQPNLFGIVYLQLCIRQCKPQKKDALMDDLKDECGNKPYTRAQKTHFGYCPVCAKRFPL